MQKGVNHMPTDKPRCTITFEDKELRDRVDSFRFENRFRSQNDAIMALINKGIEVLTGQIMEKPREDLSAEDKRLLKAFHDADPMTRYYAMHVLNISEPKEKNRA